MRTAKLSVLLVEDRQLYYFDTKKIMEASGLVENAVICSVGKEAIEYMAAAIQAKRILPDIIFINVNVAVSNGCEFLEAYEQLKDFLTKHIELYLISPSLGSPDIGRSKRFSFIKGYLTKSLMQEKLLEIFSLVAKSG